MPTASDPCGLLSPGEPAEPPPVGRFEDMMTWPEDVQLTSYRQMERVYPTRRVRCGPVVRLLPQGPALSLQYRYEGQTLGMDAFMQRTRCTGLLLLQNGQVRLERYAAGRDAQSRWPSFSVAKSISSVLLGVALREGLIQSLEQPVTDYVPKLLGSAYEQVSIRQVLQMSSGVGWNEDYLDPQSERRRMLAAQATGQRGQVLAFMAALPRVAEPGTRFNYSTGETYLVGEILAAAVGRPLSDYLSTKLWGPLGMECDALWQLDAPEGLEFAGSGLNATLRDLGRFGQFMLDQGVVDGQRLLPPDWVVDSTDVVSYAHLQPGHIPRYAPRGYGYQWWTFGDPAPAPGQRGAGLFAALGIFGQQIHIHPASRRVLVLQSAWPEPIAQACVAETAALVQTLVQDSP